MIRTPTSETKCLCFDKNTMIYDSDLGLEYVDLYLIHWPLMLKQEEFKIPIPKECIASINIKDVWEEMEKCQNLGLTKSIGVSNFSPRRIEEILSFAKIPPAVNQVIRYFLIIKSFFSPNKSTHNFPKFLQVEMNPFWQQKKLIDFCKKNDILVTGYSPLGASGSRWGNNRVMECDVLQDISNSRGKTIAQVVFIIFLSTLNTRKIICQA